MLLSDLRLSACAISDSAQNLFTLWLNLQAQKLESAWGTFSEAFSLIFVAVSVPSGFRSAQFLQHALEGV